MISSLSITLLLPPLAGGAVLDFFGSIQREAGANIACWTRAISKCPDDEMSQAK